MADAGFDTEVTDRLLTTTRSVRKRLDFDREVPTEIVMDCLERALQAPTGSNRQGWRWIVVTDEGLRRELGRIYRKGAGDYLEQGMAQARKSASAQNERVFDSAIYLAENLACAPVLVIPCIRAALPENPPRFMWAGLLGSILPAVWSFQLALRSRGLGSVFTTLHLRCEAEAAALLGVPDDFMQAALLPVAWTLGTSFKPAARRPLDEVVCMNIWR